MATTLKPKTALAALAAVGLFLPFGAPLPGSCLRVVGVAGAASPPSPSCGGDLRECLRAAADMHTTTFGGRYVTADDVARCMEAFRSCISGGASSGGHAGPPPSTSQRNRGDGTMPQRFAVTSEHFDYDCSTSGSTVTCTTKWKTASAEVDSFSLNITGSLSGMTMKGTAVSKMRYHNSGGCTLESEDTHPVSFTFRSDGSATVHTDAYEGHVNYSCPTGSGTNVIPSPAMDYAAKWSSK